MRTWELARKGIHYVDGQRNWYNSNIDLHQRSYLCARMSKEVFEEELKPFLKSYGVCYIAQSNYVWDLRGLNEQVWVTKLQGQGTVCIGWTEHHIDLDDNEIYVVMWNKHFLPKLLCCTHCFDIDIIILRILNTESYCCVL